jgi:pyridoxal 5'-phosphate synthase pdxT subunit
MPPTIGVLALQGGFDAHARALASAGFAPRLVRSAGELAGLGGLVLPGGESTAQLRLLARHGLEAPLRAFVASGAPVLATCAGLILAAATVEGPAQPSYGFLDVAVARNAWGRQLDSFEALADDGAPLTFIRAPRILRVGAGVRVLLTFEGEPVMVRQGNVTGATFHPELCADRGAYRGAFSS